MKLNVLLVAILFLGIGFVLGYLSNRETSSGWAKVVQIDGDGNTISGSKSELIGAIRKGLDIRVGWGWESGDKKLEHLADPIWIAVINQSEVMIHLDPQVLSRIDWELEIPHYEDSLLLDYEWRVAISTSGAFDAVWYNRATNQIHRRYPQKHLISWFVNNNSNDLEPTPLFLNEEEL